MKYKTIVTEYSPVAQKLAKMVEQTANEYANKGWKLVSFSTTPSAKAILVFDVSEAKE